MDIVNINRTHSTTFRIKKGTLSSDPTVNGSYDKLMKIQDSFLNNLTNVGYQVYDGYGDCMVLINRFLIIDQDLPAGNQLLACFSDNGTQASAIPEVALSSEVLQLPIFQSLLVNGDYTPVNERSRTAQNAGMSVEYILQRYASGQALPVMNRNSMSDSQRGLSEEDMKNIRVIENEMDAQQYVRDVRAAEAAQAAQSEMERSTDTPAPGDADPAKDQ